MSRTETMPYCVLRVTHPKYGFLWQDTWHGVLYRKDSGELRVTGYWGDFYTYVDLPASEVMIERVK